MWGTGIRRGLVIRLSLLSLLSLASLWMTGCDDGKTPMIDASPDTDSDSDADTDTGEPEWGDTTPCANAPGEDEVCIPGGKYLMGCVPGDADCEDNEKPLVLVELSPFFIDKYEAQLGEVIEFLNEVKDDDGIIQYEEGLTWFDGETENRIWSLLYSQHSDGSDSMSVVQQNSSGDYEFNPDVEDDGIENSCWQQGGIEAVAGGFSWLGAKMFCEWKGMQLPTEAQWEAAARGQTMNEIPCGTDPPECWYGYYDCHGVCSTLFDPEAGRCCYPFTPEKAGELCLSPFGVNGMYGNAGEWIADEADTDHSWCTDGCTDPDPVEVDYTDEHVFKGGYVSSAPQWTRISARSYGNDAGGSPTGVRCVRPDEPLVQPDAGIDAGADAGKK